MRPPPPSIPPPIVLCLAADVGLAVLFVADQATGGIAWKLTVLLHLEMEQNLPTWYSAIQLFLAAAAFGLFAWRNVSRGDRRSWTLLVLPAALLFFSIDEIAELHEWLGYKLDVLLPGGDRRNTPFWYTGIYMFVVGVPVLVAGLALIVSLRRYFASAPGVLRLLAGGFALMMLGAAGIETVANFVPVESFAHVLQVAAEECCEMLGVTLMLWAGLRLLESHGFRWQLEAWRAPGRAGLPDA